MTDLHCHILPGLDDGAKDLDVSGDLLRRERTAGVRRIAFTPHFHFERQDMDQFCRRRDAAMAELVQCYPELTSQLELKKGAEVFFFTQPAGAGSGGHELLFLSEQRG